MSSNKKDVASSVITAIIVILVLVMIHISIVVTVMAIMGTLIWLAFRLSEEKE